jgi:hypothetical protein
MPHAAGVDGSGHHQSWAEHCNNNPRFIWKATAEGIITR